MSLSDRLGRAPATVVPDTTETAPVSAIPVSAISVTGAGYIRGRGGRRVYDPLAQVRRRAHQALLEMLGPQLYEIAGDDENLARRINETLPGVLAREEALTASDRAQAFQQIIDEILGHGPIEPLLRDPEVTEIMVNAWDRIYVERYGHIQPVETAFLDEAHLRRVIDRIVSRIGRRIDESSPMVDARLPDGSRVNAVVPPISLDGAALTIRKFATEPYTITDLIRFRTLTEPVAGLLQTCVQGRLDILISGGTGSGKTTLLNVLSQFLPADERIITIEDSAELRLWQEHVLR